MASMIASRSCSLFSGKQYSKLICARLLARVDWQGKAIIDELQRNNEKVIFLVPHAWGVDIPAMLMASGGQKMAAMFHNQGNPVFDYVSMIALPCQSTRARIFCGSRRPSSAIITIACGAEA
jgi:lauroyl/myristoyl acyltransferase